MGTDVRGGRIQ